ncbi:MAG: beta-lactamase family protein, partial [Acidobacteria bacterium]|nr:beta-lactamase family protein [Acidobacteriota bacterium]
FPRFPVLLLALSAASAAAQSRSIPPPADCVPVRQFIRQAIAEGRSPSVAVAVIRDNRVVWAEGFGTADRERNIPATSDTIYWLASVSKPLTATGLMQLVERGAIDLDKPANTYLPGAKLRAHLGSADDITIRRMANHTAGLPIHNNFFYAPARPPSMEETIRRYGFASLKPGTANQYSNLAFGILGYIVETVSKTPWSRYQEKRVYDPLGMARTSDGIRPGHEREAAVPYAHDAAGRFVRVVPYDFDHRPASAIWSTVNDLARFARMHMNDGELDGVRVLTPESVREMRRMTGESRPGTGNGVAWLVGSLYGYEGAVSHNGGMPGVATVMNTFPKPRAATIVLTNSDDRALPVEISHRLAAVLFGDAPPQQAARPGAPGAAEGPPALAGSWRGRVAHPDGAIAVVLTVKQEGGVDVAFEGRPPLSLSRVALTESTLRGQVQALVATQEGFHGIPELTFALARDGDRLTGVCSAFVPSYFTLPFWMELERSR